jgi:hypothetical protein
MPQQHSSRVPTPLGPPSDVTIGPLTHSIIAGARWQGHDSFPARQTWADDVESVLLFLYHNGRFDRFRDLIQKQRNPQHRDAMLAEARGSFYLGGHGFKILEWEPLGEGTALGEARAQLGASPAIFVEVKQPSWQGEHLPLTVAEKQRLSPEDLAARLARMKQPRFLPNVCEGAAVGSHHFSMSVVRRNALHKLTATQPNLVIVVDDCKVTPVGLPSLAPYVESEFLQPTHDPNDPEDCFTYERLGGVLFLNAVSFGVGVEYNVEFVANPYVIPACALPLEVVSLFGALTAETDQREEARYANSNFFLHSLMNRSGSNTHAVI